MHTQFKEVKQLLLWSAFSATISDVHKRRSWRGYFDICEAKQGIARVRLKIIGLHYYLPRRL